MGVQSKNILGVKPEIQKQATIFNETFKEAEELKAYIFLAKRSFEIGDLTSASNYLAEEFRTSIPLFHDCAILFEKIALKYVETKQIDEALEHIRYAISSWTEETKRLDLQNQDIQHCQKKIEYLSKLYGEIEKTNQQKSKIKED
ncbi:hypothetical protein KO317_00240 [Candidatus Micrarchaeota archaeon]|nr:hypothetical protein [Candidatus Micrarchaeota archaeon]